MACELEPLSWKVFEEYHRNAWENGWTYGPAHTELYLEYLNNWDCFLEYVDCLISKLSPQNNCIKILIGEAPPFWAGNSKQEDRSYFYNVKQTRGSTWLNAPYKYFHYLKYPNGNAKNIIEIESKSLKFKKGISIKKGDKLSFLAEQGVILLDIFPFPIRQTTKIRETVTSNFSDHFEKYFKDFYKKVKSYISDRTKEKKISIEFKYALVTPVFTGLQILYGSKSKLFFKEIVDGDKPLQIRDFSHPGSIFDIQTYINENFNKSNSFRTFFGKIAFDSGIWTIKELNPFKEKCDYSKTPILMDTSGNVNFSNFFNVDITNLRKKINSKEKDSEDEA